jgi:hypothetical protein
MLNASDLRALRARKRVLLYDLAVRVRLNPATLSAVLNEKKPLPPALAERIRDALETSREVDE